MLPSLVEELPDGVGRVRLPTPFRVRVNCYILFDPPVTVIDPGTLQPGSLAKLRAALNANGLDFDDVEQVVVTHAHPDHAGAAAVLAARADARLLCGLPEVKGLIASPDVAARRDLLLRLGVPDGVARALIAETDAIVDRVVRRAQPSMVHGVRDGESLVAGGRQLVSVITSGHADGHLSLWDPAGGMLLSGDHLLARIIPAPSLDVGDRLSGRRSMNEYLASLSRFVELDPKIVLPGHGRAFTEVGVLAARLRCHSRERAEQIARILRAGPATPFEVAKRLQWQPEGRRLLFGLAHTQGHLDLLADAGRVIPEEHGALVRYRLRG